MGIFCLCSWNPQAGSRAAMSHTVPGPPLSFRSCPQPPHAQYPSTPKETTGGQGHGGGATRELVQALGGESPRGLGRADKRLWGLSWDLKRVLCLLTERSPVKARMWKDKVYRNLGMWEPQKQGQKSDLQPLLPTTPSSVPSCPPALYFHHPAHAEMNSVLV